jgi:hypothetical protein
MHLVECILRRKAHPGDQARTPATRAYDRVCFLSFLTDAAHSPPPLQRTHLDLVIAMRARGDE